MNSLAQAGPDFDDLSVFLREQEEQHFLFVLDSLTGSLQDCLI